MWRSISSSQELPTSHFPSLFGSKGVQVGKGWRYKEGKGSLWLENVSNKELAGTHKCPVSDFPQIHSYMHTHSHTEMYYVLLKFCKQKLTNSTKFIINKNISQQPLLPPSPLSQWKSSLEIVIKCLKLYLSCSISQVSIILFSS